MAMDAKDLRTEAALGERSNDSNGKYSQGETTLQCDRGKLYQDIPTNTLAKADAHSTRPCAVIGPDRVVLPAAANDLYSKKSAPIEPWPSSENPYRRPPDYPYKLADYQHPTRNISPRQTFQENMQRIMMPPRYNPVKANEDSNYATDGNIAVHKSNKLNVPSDIDVPYTLNAVTSDQRNIRNSELCVSDVNPVLVQNVPPGWSNTGVNVRPMRPYGVPELYQYPEYPSCAGSRPIPMARQRMVHEEPNRVYPESYYHEGNVRFKPYPIIKERYPQPRYEYISNYTNPYQPPPFPSQKYDLQKSLPPHAYPSYPQVPLKYMNSRMVEPIMEGYPRVNQQTNYNLPFRTQVVHSNYGPLPGNCLQNKFYGCPSDGSVKAIGTNKLPYENNKMYFEYENAHAKAHPLSENFYANDTSRSQPMKGSLVMPNYGQMNIHTLPPQTYHRKEGPQMKSYEYLHHFRYMEPQINNPLSKIPSQFSPNAMTISPTDSNTSNDITQTLGTSQEDYGYVSQSSSASIRSMDSGVNKTTNDIYKRYDYRCNYVVRNSLLPSKPKLNSNSNIISKDNVKKDIDVRQFLQMWNEGDDEISENNSNKEINMQVVSQKANLSSERHGMVNNQEQLYVLGLVNVSSDELSKYEHIQKVSKLPENIKGYNSTELLNQFEEVIESSNLNNFNSKPVTTREVSTRKTTTVPHGATIQRPLSPLDVEAKISQSVIHKEVGCNFEIKPCSPKMLNVEIAAPIQTILGERIIEKVSNPHMKSSTTSHKVNENNCNKIKCQNQFTSLNENLKTPSCKMVNAQCSTNDNSIKTDYDLQDLEGNSGVCLASLPRLDNDIELNFPEVNQQFIKANKMDSVITTCPKDLPTLDTEQFENIVINDNKQERTDTNFHFSSETETDKEFMKLSKYRKQKKSDLETSVQALRTDSVIIKNPENVKDLDENSELSTNILIKKVQQSPINLSPRCEISTKADPEFNETADTKIRKNECPTNIPNTNSDISIISDNLNVDVNSTNACVPSSNCQSLISNNELSIDKRVCPNLSNNDNLSSSTMISNNDPLLQHLEENLLNSNEAVSNNGKSETETINSDITAVLNYEVPKIQANDAMVEVSENKDEIDKFVKNIVQNETNFNAKECNVNKMYSIDEDGLSNKSGGCPNFECELPQNKTSVNDETLKYAITKPAFDEKVKSDSTASLSASNVVNKDSNDDITYGNMDVFLNDEQRKETSENSDTKKRNCTEKNISYMPTDKLRSNSVSEECDTTHGNYSEVCFDDHNTKISLGEYITEMQNTKSLSGDLKTYHEINNEKLERGVSLKTFRYIHKELYSPWIQKLLMYSEGNYTRLFDDNLIEKSYHGFNQTKDLDIKTQLSSHSMFNANDTNNIISKSEVINIENLSNVVPTTVKTNCAIHSDDGSDKSRKDYNCNDFEDNIRQENETINAICDNVDSEPIFIQTKEGNDDLTETSIEINVINTITSTIEHSNTIDISKSEFCKDTATNNTTQLPENTDTSLDTKCNDYNNEIHCKNVYRQGDYKFPYKQNIHLKRSLSDSALDAYCDDNYYTNSKQRIPEKKSLWPNKRKKIMDSQNTIETQILTGNFCNIIQNNRRNSVSSIYNEEAVSFCILIEDENCIITEETEDSDKVCFPEIISEDSLPNLEPTEIINDEGEKNVPTTLEITTSQDESNGDYSNSLAFECLEEKILQDSWVEDVACVETVISEEFVADVTISASNSPKSVSEYICNDNNEAEDFGIVIDEHEEEVMDTDNIMDNDFQFIETNVTPVIDINGSLNDRKSQIVEHNSSLEETFLEVKQVDTPPVEPFHSLFNSSNSIQLEKKENEKDTSPLQCHLSKFGNNLFQNNEQSHFQSEKPQDDTVHSCESSIDNVFSYREKEEIPKYMTSSSPEVSSTTSEEKKSSILLKITNYKGSRISQVNNFGNNENNIPSSKFTEEKYLNSNDLSTIRPLLTKAAQKYIPPLKETIRNFKVKLPLPQDSLIRLKQLKKSKEKPKPVMNFNLNRHNNNVTRQEFPKKQKPNFEDVLKSIDEIQFQMHKEKTKKAKKFIPKVVIKKHENGSHYTSTSDKDTFSPDLTGSKWQPWVFLERNMFVDRMALKGKTRAIYNHRKNIYVLAEKFQKYKSIDSTNFIISQASLNEPKGQLKYTIRLQNRY